MEIRHGKQFGFPPGDPILPVFALTLRAVSVPTAIVADSDGTAFGAGIHMSAQICRAAAFQRRQGEKLPTVDLRMVFHCLPVLPKQVRDFEAGGHLLNRYKLSSGLKARHFAVWATWR